MTKDKLKSRIVISEKEKMVVSGIELKTSFAEGRQAREIPPFFHGNYGNKVLSNIPGRINENTLCVFFRKPESPDFTYFMGVETDSESIKADGLISHVIEAKTYASLEIIKRGNEDVGRAFALIVEDWLPESGWQLADGPAFIYYDQRFKSIYEAEGYSGNPPATVYVPIKK